MTSQKSATAASQTDHAQRTLRQLIVDGLLPGGQRVTELAMVDKLGVSRTPVRAALAALQAEGLLDALPHGGYTVRHFSEADLTDAVELRGMLEGMLVRVAAEQGVRADLLDRARGLLDEIDRALATPVLGDASLAQYVRLNAQFHDLLPDMAARPLLARELARVRALPFASPSAFVGVHSRTRQSRDMLVVAQDQHRQVLDAVARGEGARAEALMREHARLALRNLRAAMQLAASGVAAGATAGALAGSAPKRLLTGA